MDNTLWISEIILLAFVVEFYPHYVSKLIYEDWVQSGLVKNDIEFSFVEIHNFNIHLGVLQALFLLIFLTHCLHADITLIDTDNLLIFLLKHLLRQSRITSTNIQNTILFIDICGDKILNSTESLIPIERFWISKIMIYFTLCIFNPNTHFFRIDSFLF